MLRDQRYACAYVFGAVCPARYTGVALVLPDNVSLLRLPSCSPELNGQENIWGYLRQNYPAGRIFTTILMLRGAKA